MKKYLFIILLAGIWSCENNKDDSSDSSDFTIVLVGEWKMIKIVETSIFESETSTADGSAYFVTLSLNEDNTISWVGLVSWVGLWNNGDDEFDFIGMWSIAEDRLTIISGGNTFEYEYTLSEEELKLEIEYSEEDKLTEVQFYFTKL